MRLAIGIISILFISYSFLPREDENFNGIISQELDSIISDFIDSCPQADSPWVVGAHFYNYSGDTCVLKLQMSYYEGVLKDITRTRHERPTYESIQSEGKVEIKGVTTFFVLIDVAKNESCISGFVNIDSLNKEPLADFPSVSKNIDLDKVGRGQPEFIRVYYLIADGRIVEYK